METKFCKFCGEKIASDAVICTKCGRQVEEIKTTKPEQPQVVINNSNAQVGVGVGIGVLKNKWTAFLLCFFLGYLGAHKFYEGKTGMGVLYLLTGGLFGFGWLIDTIVLLFKPTEYYV